jgi:transposase InsO family protein
MSRKGNCLDNAVAESFFSSLKNELAHHTLFEDRDEARSAIFDYLEVFYNRQRIHQRCLPSGQQMPYRLRQVQPLE